jgi:hypothetical protein
VDPVSALPNDARDFNEPCFAGVIDLERAASDEAEVIDREHNSVKDRSVRVVERAIDENVFTAQTSFHPPFPRDALG